MTAISYGVIVILLYLIFLFSSIDQSKANRKATTNTPPNPARKDSMLYLSVEGKKSDGKVYRRFPHGIPVSPESWTHRSHCGNPERIHPQSSPCNPRDSIPASHSHTQTQSMQRRGDTRKLEQPDTPDSFRTDKSQRDCPRKQP